jgi:hypothetical protein
LLKHVARLELLDVVAEMLASLHHSVRGELAE